MSKKLKVAGPATNDELGAAYQASRVPHERERLWAIRMAQQGEWTCEKIAHTVGRGRDPMVRWVRAYRQGGSPRLLERRYEGRREKKALVDGLRRGPWKPAKAIRRWLQRARGIELQLGGVDSGLKQLEARGKVPRKSHTRGGYTRDCPQASSLGHPGRETGPCGGGRGASVWLDPCHATLWDVARATTHGA